VAVCCYRRWRLQYSQLSWVKILHIYDESRTIWTMHRAWLYVASGVGVYNTPNHRGLTNLYSHNASRTIWAMHRRWLNVASGVGVCNTPNYLSQHTCIVTMSHELYEPCIMCGYMSLATLASAIHAIIVGWQTYVVTTCHELYEPCTTYSHVLLAALAFEIHPIIAS